MLAIDADTYQALRAHGCETYPHECCGVLLGHSEGDVNTVVRAVRAGNIRTDSAHNRYQIAPAELIRVQRTAREAGMDIVGFYHSHPDHPAMWSTTDFAEAHWLGCSYVITSIRLGDATETNSFRLQGTTEDDKQFVQETIAVPQVDEAAQDSDTPPVEAAAAGDRRC